MFEINQLGPFTSMSDQDRTSPYNIITVLSRKLMRISKTIIGGLLVQNQILWTNIIRIVEQKVRRTTNKIFGVKGYDIF